nr:type IV pilus biogenesis/stability protein PilW [Motiliproteus sp. SC1-56]
MLLGGCATQTTVDGRAAKQGSKEERLEAWNSVAREYIQLGQYEEAKRPLKQALEVDPKAASSLTLLALVFQSQGETEIAEEYYRKALEGDPDNAMVNNNYGIFLMLQQRHAEACGYLEAAARDPLYEQRSATLENLASCYRVTGQSAEAEKTYRQVLRLDPNASQAILALSELAYQRGEYGQSWQLFSRFSKLVNLRQVEHNAQSLWLGIRLSRQGQDPGMAATYSLLLKNLYPQSREYQLYKESRQ